MLPAPHAGSHGAGVLALAPPDRGRDGSLGLPCPDHATEAAALSARDAAAATILAGMAAAALSSPSRAV